MQFLYTLNHKKCRIYSHFNFLKYHRNTHNVFLTTFVQCKVSNANIYFYNTKQAYKHSKTENYIDVFIILDRRFCFQLSDLALRKPANVYFGVVGCDVPTFTGKNVLSPPEPNFITVGQSYRYQCIPGYIARGQEHTCTKPGKFEPEQPNVKCCRYHKLLTCMLSLFMYRPKHEDWDSCHTHTKMKSGPPITFNLFMISDHGLPMGSSDCYIT